MPSASPQHSHPPIALEKAIAATITDWCATQRHGVIELTEIVPALAIAMAAFVTETPCTDCQSRLAELFDAYFAQSRRTLSIMKQQRPAAASCADFHIANQ